MSKFKIERLPIDGPAVITSQVHSDPRGVFARLFCADELAEFLGERSIVNVNFSRTEMKGAVRGLHFQHPPHAEVKFVRCLSGRIFDVVVDLRAGSPTFLQWTGVELSSDQFDMIHVPEGFAHGFQVLTAPAEIVYFCSEYYHPDAEDGLSATDPSLMINWPLEVSQLSERDEALPLLKSREFPGINLS